jgi:hypothetical protein
MLSEFVLERLKTIDVLAKPQTAVVGRRWKGPVTYVCDKCEHRDRCRDAVAARRPVVCEKDA